MTQDEIIRMAREAGFFTDGNNELCCKDYDGICSEELERFAALVAAHEREACAKVCDEQSELLHKYHKGAQAEEAKQCAAAIRARGNNK